MKILTITAFYPPHHSGGYELRCYDVLGGLRKRGHDVVVLTNHCQNPTCSMHQGETGIHRTLHLRLQTTSVVIQILWDTKDLGFIDSLMENYKPDLVYLWHIQNLSNTILPYFSSKNTPIVFDEGGSSLDYLARIQKRGIYFFKNDHDSFLKKRLKGAIYASAIWFSGNLIQPDWGWPQKMHIYFNSRAAKQYALAQGAPVADAAVIPSGIDLSRFPFQPRQSINLPIRIIIPARIKPEKGTLDGVHLLHALAQRGIPSNLTLLGKVQSQAYFDEITRAIHDFGLNDSVTYQPMLSQAELGQLYCQSDLCFFPSYFKTGLSRVPLEAMASGCLLISYGNEGSIEVIRSAENGFLIPEGNINAAADCLKTLLEEPLTYQNIIRKAREDVESEHDLENYLDLIEEFLMKSLKSTIPTHDYA